MIIGPIVLPKILMDGTLCANWPDPPIRALEKAALEYIRIVNIRIMMGKTPDGDSFEAYKSKAYEKQKLAATGKIEWLTNTGIMLRNFRAGAVKKSGKTYRIVCEFGGMHPKTTFVLRERKVKDKRTGRILTMTVKQSMGQRLTRDQKLVNEAQPNAVIAAKNNETRPFIEVNAEEIEMIRAYFQRCLMEEMQTKRDSPFMPDLF